jgi:hypothetical protein
MPDFLLARMLCAMIESMGPTVKATLDWHGCDSVCHPRPNAPADRPAASAGTVRPVVVCLCGSGRFREAFDQAEFDETLAGRIVLTIGCNTKDVARHPDLAKHKPILDALHLRKIDLADEVLVLNVGGYIGESTRREIEYAERTGKPIRYAHNNAICVKAGKESKP